jgi:hypothetical protein
MLTRYGNLMVYLAEDHVAPMAEAFAELEELLGWPLPPDYQHFLEACNGAYLNYQIEVVAPDGARDYLGFGITFALAGDGGPDTNPFELMEAREADGFPQEGVLPVARDAEGNGLCLDLRDGARVVAFVHGVPAWSDLVEHESLIEVAPSFQDYLERLFIPDGVAEQAIEEFDGAEGADIAIEAMIEWLDSGNDDWREKFADLWNDRVPTHPV